jgi:uridine kinase
VTRANEIIVAEVQLHLSAHGAPLVVGLDGRSGSGKSTLAASLALAVGGAAVNVDDFSNPGPNADTWTGSTESKVDEAIDWRRLRAEALQPLLAGKVASWHPFDFVGRMGLDARVITCSPAPVIILDGLYSTRPELVDLINFSVLVEAPDNLRALRLVAREGEEYIRKWQPIWDAAEDYYFTVLRPRGSFDLVVVSDEG